MIQKIRNVYLLTKVGNVGNDIGLGLARYVDYVLSFAQPTWAAQ